MIKNKKGITLLDMLIGGAIGGIVLALSLTIITELSFSMRNTFIETSERAGIKIFRSYVISDLSKRFNSTVTLSQNGFIVNGYHYRMRDGNLVRTFQGRDISLGEGILTQNIITINGINYLRVTFDKGIHETTIYLRGVS